MGTGLTHGLGAQADLGSIAARKLPIDRREKKWTADGRC
jgi:hypothetical protein